MLYDGNKYVRKWFQEISKKKLDKLNYEHLGEKHVTHAFNKYSYIEEINY